MSKGCVVALVLAGLLVLGAGGCTVSAYNRIVTSEQRIESSWSEIQNQYKRRFDLVPQLVETVKGAADFERETLQRVVDARASVGRMQLPAEVPEDPAALRGYMEAQQTLGASLGRLLVVAEQYPELRASQSFLSLQDQLEGTENRIAVARRDYIEAVRAYNTDIKTMPERFVAVLVGFEPKPQLEFEEPVTERPEFEFDFGK